MKCAIQINLLYLGGKVVNIRFTSWWGAPDRTYGKIYLNNLDLVNAPLTVSRAEQVWLPAWFWAWQEYFPACLLCMLVTCRVAVLFPYVIWRFSASFSSCWSFSQVRLMGSEPFRVHCRETSLPTSELTFSSFRTKDGGSTSTKYTKVFISVWHKTRICQI